MVRPYLQIAEQLMYLPFQPQLANMLLYDYRTDRIIEGTKQQNR